MNNFLVFWKKDGLNKLIVALFFLILASFLTIVIVLFRVPVGSSGQGLASMLFASSTPTVDLPARYTSMAQTALVEETPAYLRGLATITNAFSGLPTRTATPLATDLTPLAPSSTPTPASTSQTSPTSSLGGVTVSGVICIPGGTPQKGRVLDILDGVSAKIFMDDLVFTVHYIGIDLPAVAGYADAAAVVNGQMVYGRDVMLYDDPVGKDTLGLLSRYIVIDGKLVNLELIKLGLVTVVDVPSGFACHQAFLDAEAAAKAAKVGQWK